MKLFRFRGGVHPETKKEGTSGLEIESLPLPSHLYIPLQQHIGAPAEPEVTIGQHVLKGELLAHSQGMISAPVHAPTSGTIKDIIEFTAPHPSGLPVMTIVLESDGQDKWGQNVVPLDPFKLSTDEIAARVGAAGVVGLGGATFPSAVKLGLGKQFKIDTLVINGSECEPYLTCDDRLMQERPDEVIDGIRIMAHALGVSNTLVAIEDNKPAAFASLSQEASKFPNIEVVSVPTLYPMGSEKQLIKTLTGKEIPAGKLASDIGMVMHNVATARAVHHAVRYGRPLVSRIVTVAGDAVAKPRNIEVLVGTLVKEVLSHCGLKVDPTRLLLGGPMMGNVIPHSDVPVTKGANGILALSTKEARKYEPQPCIRCSSCVSVCPVGLMPLEMASRIRKKDFNAAVDIGLSDCISCGSCSYVCPSHIPLVHYFNHAKGELKAMAVTNKKNEYTKKLTQARIDRQEAIQRAKDEAAAKRKAEKEAKEAKMKAMKEAKQQGNS